MQFKKIESIKTKLSSDSLVRKWSGRYTFSAVNLGNIYTLKCTVDINSSMGISKENYKLLYLKKGKWLHIATGLDINIDLDSFDLTSYDEIYSSYKKWISRCCEYVELIEAGFMKPSGN